MQKMNNIIFMTMISFKNIHVDMSRLDGNASDMLSSLQVGVHLPVVLVHEKANKYGYTTLPG